ncbi:MAG: tetratricopeptide repeat protein [Oligoflexia bacterium]|nr:tetratricopeptide repeat protein [Oligoflexia bacterium]
MSKESYRVGALILLALAAFGISAGNQFAFDDLVRIVQYADIRTVRGSLGSFWHALFPGNLYRPLPTVSYGLTYALFGLNPLPYHLCNIFLHCCNALFLFLLLSRARSMPSQAAFMIAALFAVHPLATETVANVSGRPELMAGFFGLLLLLRCSKFVQQNRGELSWSEGSALLVWTFLALLSKESALCLPLLSALIVCFCSSGNVRRRLWLILLPQTLAISIYLGLRLYALHALASGSDLVQFVDNPLIALTSMQRMLSAWALLGRYATLAIFPFNLSADYSYAQLIPLAMLPNVQGLFGITAASALLVTALSGVRHRSAEALFAGWFFLAFVVTSNLAFPIGTIFGERLAYLPSCGTIGLLVLGLGRLQNRTIRGVLFGTLLTGFIWASNWRSLDWYDSDTLHTAQSKISPQSAKTLVNYGVVLRNGGDLDEADLKFRMALAVYPEFPDAAYNLGINYLSKGLESGARYWFKRALKLNDQFAPALDALGRMYLRAGDFQKASGKFQKILDFDPRNFDAGLGMLAVYLGQNNLAEAKLQAELLRQRDPSNPELQALQQKLNESNLADG